MKLFLKKFASDEAGAVTVDWVVLTAATVGLGFLVITAITSSVNEKTTTISATIVAKVPS